MNNEQFRRLVLGSTAPKTTPSSKQNVESHTPTRGVLLGSRGRPSLPMTPRSVTGVDFARQLADSRRETGQPLTKRFKSSAAPKGTKLPSNYQDRALLRQSQSKPESDIERRIDALRDMVKLGHIDQRSFDKLRSELGSEGHVEGTHIAKGLDWDLLRRTKAGEGTMQNEDGGAKDTTSEETTKPAIGDVDEEFDRLLDEKEKSLTPSAPKEKKEKQGNLAPPPAITPGAGQKMSRDDILTQLKANRAAAAAGVKPGVQARTDAALGSRFKRMGILAGTSEKKRWIEQDKTGRQKEVLLITDSEGKTKRKVRWLDKPGWRDGNVSLPAPDPASKPLGMEVPAALISKTQSALEVEDDDIFAGVGAEYNPLADIGDEDASSSDEAEEQEKEKDVVGVPHATAVEKLPDESKRPTTEPLKLRNYFSTSTNFETTAPAPPKRTNPLTEDPAVLAALKKAATLRQTSVLAETAHDEREDEDVDEETLLRRKKFLEEARRREAQDAMDLDLGFGSSRIEDEEDEAILYEGRGGKKRKRGPKKKAGDKNSAADVLRVLEGRRTTSG